LKEEKVKEKVDKGDFNFDGAKLYMIHFRSKVERDLSFNGAVIREDALSNGAEIGGNALFVGAKMGRTVYFEEAKIDGDVTFDSTEIKGACSFKDAEFKIPKAQEEACRTARITQERKGDRVLADYHFYREMEAKSSA